VKAQIAAGQKHHDRHQRDPSQSKAWETGPYQKPNRYIAVTTVRQNGKIVDTYETPFGIRTLKFDPNAGFFLNGEHIKTKRRLQPP
jgi:beta-galactosidase